MNSSRPIGILTLHYGFNEGAILQAAALARALENALPERSARIVDQRYPAKLDAYGPPRTARERALQNAVDHWLPLLEPTLIRAGHHDAFALIRRQCAAVVVGSDQVWCLKYRARLGGLIRTQPYGFYPAFPNAYWPDAAVGVPRIAYAASVGTLDWGRIPTMHRRAMDRILSGFALLSVREQRSLDFLAWISPRLAARAHLVPDPTFAADLLADSNRTELCGRLAAAGVDFARPRLGVVAGQHPEVRKLAEAYRRDGWQVVGITTPNDCCDVELWNHELRPLDWAALFGCLDLCVSERMHASIFCLLNRTPLVMIDINEPAPGSNPDTKMLHLARRFGLEGRVVPRGALSFERLWNAAHEGWDSGGVDRTVACLRGEATAFLDRIVPMLAPEATP